jgi:hypothetical protein
MGLVDGHTAHGEALGCRSGRVGACGAGVAGSESQSPTTGDAGAGDPAYRAASRRRRTVPDACRLGLGRTVRHDPYRVGPWRGVGGRFEGGIGEAALLCGQAALGADRRQSCDQSFKTCMKSG